MRYANTRRLILELVHEYSKSMLWTCHPDEEDCICLAINLSVSVNLTTNPPTFILWICSCELKVTWYIPKEPPKKCICQLHVRSIPSASDMAKATMGIVENFKPPIIMSTLQRTWNIKPCHYALWILEIWPYHADRSYTQTYIRRPIRLLHFYDIEPFNIFPISSKVLCRAIGIYI